MPKQQGYGRDEKEEAQRKNLGATAPGSSRLVVHPRKPGRRLVLRQANALVIWTRTTSLLVCPACEIYPMHAVGMLQARCPNMLRAAQIGKHDRVEELHNALRP
ncbi:MAG TPA: hypothetical protein VFI90_07710, partial [Rubrobacter sp.]|nr:hypothetical protein [Rubrobacter sp.]